MNFEPEERQHLQSPGLEALAAKERENILGVHQRMFAADGGELRALRLAGAPGDTLWAACLVNSRCFSETVSERLWGCFLSSGGIMQMRPAASSLLTTCGLPFGVLLDGWPRHEGGVCPCRWMGRRYRWWCPAPTWPTT